MKNIMIAQGGGPTAVINATLAGAIYEAKIHPEVDKIYIAVGGLRGLLDRRIKEVSNLSDEQLFALRDTPAAGAESCRYKCLASDYPKIVQKLKEYEIDCFFYNGGNDSMDTCNKISKIVDDINVIGLPKTIDNDLAITDHCPGFGSAARYAAISVCELGLDIRSLPLHVCIIELMGRNAGWLTASSAMASELCGNAPHLIYLPERPFNLKDFLKDIQTTWEKEGPGIVVAVSEGLVDDNGNTIASASDVKDSFGHDIAGGVGSFLASSITAHLGLRARSEQPGILQRCSQTMVSLQDREEAWETGRFGLLSAVSGKSGYMVGISRVKGKSYKVEYTLIPLDTVANVEKKLPDEFINAEGNGVTEAFLDYLRPLLGGNFPKYFTIDYEEN